jgi:lipid A 3-O-deacylase
MKGTIFACLFMILCYSMQAQVNDSVLQKPENYFRYNYDNDFFSATDRYYTQGVRLVLILNSLRKNPVAKLFFRVNRTAKNYHGIAFQRDGFTPRSIRHDSVFYGERPYASVCFLSSFLISFDKEKQQKVYSQLDLGVIGPNAKGEEEQKYIHRKLKNIQPLGWEYQVANDIVLNYTLQYEKGFLIKRNVEFIGLIEGRLGTLYDDISMGSTIRLGVMQEYFSVSCRYILVGQVCQKMGKINFNATFFFVKS